MLDIILFSFVSYYFLSLYYFENLKGSDRKTFLMVTTAIIAIIIGIRNPIAWSDSGVYLEDFIENVKSFGELSILDRPGNYDEMGFYYLGVISKTIYDSSTFYFIFVSGTTMLLLYLCLEKYSIYPFIALYIYLGRFVGRNTIQIRAAIAIVIVIWGTVYVTKRQLWKYLLVVFVASRFHTSAYMAFPLYFMNYVNIKKGHIYLGIVASLVIAAYFGTYIQQAVSQSDIANEWARSYIEEDSEKAYSNSLANPVIWYQIIILVFFTIYESRLSKLTEHYYTIRNAYFYSTVLLIVLCQYAILAARLSTIFATYEMIIIPLLCMMVKGNRRLLFYFGIGALYAILLYFNIRKFV